MVAAEIERNVYDFIENDLLLGATKIAASTSLFEGRVLDSMHLSELIDFVETKFKIRVSPSEINFRNLDSVQNITRFVASKL